MDWGQITLGVIGFGRMGAALVHSALASGLTTGDRIVAFDTDESLLENVAIRTTGSAGAVASLADVVIIAVKPHHVPAVLAEIRDADIQCTLVISIAAGIELAALRGGLGESPVQIVRAMPNLAVTVGMSITALVAEPTTGRDRLKTAESFFESCGSVVHLAREEEMHVFTALASSGPAFAAVFAEALADGAVSEGLSRKAARSVTAQMLRGAAELLTLESGSPAELKDLVSSPGGTTIAGLVELEKAGFRSAAIHAIKAATARSRQLGQR